jgi:hypothetical protein
MVLLPHLLNGVAIPAVASLLNTKSADSKDAASSKNAFEKILRSELDSKTGGAERVAGTEKAAAASIKTAAAEFTKTLDAAIAKAKDKMTASNAGAITPGIMLLPVNNASASLKAGPAQTLKIPSAVQPVAATPDSANQIKIAGDNPGLVLMTQNQNQSVSASGWDKYRLEAMSLNKKGNSPLSGNSVVLGLKIPMG